MPNDGQLNIKLTHQAFTACCLLESCDLERSCEYRPATTPESRHAATSSKHDSCDALQICISSVVNETSSNMSGSFLAASRSLAAMARDRLPAFFPRRGDELARHQGKAGEVAAFQGDGDPFGLNSHRQRHLLGNLPMRSMKRIFRNDVDESLDQLGIELHRPRIAAIPRRLLPADGLSDRRGPRSWRRRRRQSSRCGRQAECLRRSEGSARADCRCTRHGSCRRCR